MDIKKIFIISLLLIAIILLQLFTNNVFADLPPDPGTGGPGTGDIPVGGGSPIDGGLFVLLGMGLTYGAKKIYRNLRSKNR